MSEDIQIRLKDLKCDTIKVADLMKDVEIIPLEDTISFMISWPKTFIVTENGFFLHDNPSPEVAKILYFDKHGKALNHIGAIGNGRGEYVTIWDTATDRKGDTIIVTSINKNLLYDKSGKFLTSKEFGFDCLLKTQTAKTSSGYICATDYDGSDYLLHVYDKDLNLIDELLPTNGLINTQGGDAANKIRTDGDKVYYCDGLNSAFYYIDLSDSKRNKRYHFIDDEMLSSDKPRMDYEKGPVFAMISGYYMENENIICYIYRKDAPGTNIKINTKTNEVRQFVYDGWFPGFRDYYDGHYYMLVDPTRFLEYVEEHEYESDFTKSEFVKILKKVYKSSGLKIEEKSNYVILKF
ncbi:MAG: 6-bladed beta-propeller [Bacteroidaceae bacterium]|nr:6-bladed beta-propeller [Bacteroidaceae bacterium]